MLLLVLSSAISMALAANPWFCHGLNCPTFTSLQNITENGQTVDMRKYPAQLWVSTNITDEDFNDALNTGFNRLFEYINGSNEAGMSIDMTAPVLDYIISDGRKEVYVVSFYVPYAYQPPNKAPPKPSNPTVYIETKPEITVGVIAFDGFENPREDQVEEDKVCKVLSKDGIQYDENDWFFAGYDPPFRVTGRHNEVWVQAYNYPN
eukprot:CAMPEP_0201568060 /NCGR_PEP_ID=MMETSP0190_2-20130828/8912_1 /ASSEMBLY_ACC=CAM_ASM_000263 /TAXON_ID=37353 /ORGANISM="Rosalina sp." /LENGTH=205 /DNA_ID=CAMNT_0047988765 /DNA_START=92 /DNA_END=709 /DNA_ORIENTATION=-